MCKAPVKSSPPTNRHPTFLQARYPSCRPTNSVRALKGESITLHGLALLKLTLKGILVSSIINHGCHKVTRVHVDTALSESPGTVEKNMHRD